MKHTSDLILRHRLELNLSQWDVAKRVHYKSPQFISNIERRISVIPRDKIKPICKLLKIDLKEFKKAIKRDLREVNEEYISNYLKSI